MSDAPEAAVWRWRHLAVCAALVALAVVQDPGRVVPDTKLDLSVDPAAFLGRATSVWDETGFAGQLQNQAYGYLEPMGAFFVIGHAVAQPWLVQRLWWGLVLVVAFLGARRLAAELGVGTPATRVVAGLAFALTPHVLSVLGPVSAEAWPTALAPWVVVPLVAVARGRRGPWAGGVTAAAPVVLMGGVNAALDLAAVVPAAVFLAAQGLSPRVRRTWLAWVGATALGTLWWVVPLLVLGRYSPPFLDYIESASTTTLVTSLADSLRGASHWVAYLSPGIGGTWRLGRDLVLSPPLVLYSMLVAAAGGAGLAVRGLRERGWLLACLAVSLAVLVGGHAATFGSPVDGTVRSLLDGALAPLRNVHKFDVGVRIPVVLGLAHLLASVPDLVRGLPARRALVAGVVGTAVIAVGGSALPALSGRVAPVGSFTALPGYWQEAATWLEQHPRGRTLLAPESRFASYGWGLPADEPLQALTTAPWEVHNAVPLTPPGHIRLLDGVDRALASGRAVPGLATTLSRAGIGYVLVRGDLDVARAGAPRLELVRATLAASGGLTPVAGFGPRIGGTDPALGASLRGPDVQDAPVLQVWAVTPAPVAADLTDTADVVEVAGGPEGLIAVSAAGLLPATTAAVLAVDRTGPAPRRLVLTDSLTRREVDVGRSDAETSDVLEAGDDGVQERPGREYALTDDPAQETTATWLGARAVTATSSAASVGNPGGARPWESPAQAFDGDDATAWWPAPGDDDPGLTIRWVAPVTPGEVVVRLDPGDAGDLPARVRVVTDDAVADAPVTGRVARVRLAGPVTTLGVETAPGGSGPRVGVAEVEVGGAPVRAARRTPALDLVNREAAVVLQTDPGRTDGCVGRAAAPFCSSLLVGHGEEDAGIVRVLPVEGRDDFEVAATARSVGGPALDGLAQRAAGLALRARATSSAVSALGGSAFAAVDGNPDTVWSPAADDPAPALRLSWDEPVRVRTLLLVPPAEDRAATPRTIRVTIDGTDLVRAVDPDGTVTVPATPARSLEVGLLDEPVRGAFDPVTGLQQRLPVGVADVEVAGVPVSVADLATRVDLPCGAGPRLQVGARTLRTGATVRLADLATSAPFDLRVCDAGPVTLADGDHVVAVPATDAVAPDRVVLTGSRWSGPAAGTAVTLAPGRAEADFSGLPGTAGVLARTVNVNPGWRARDPDVPAVVVDGWRQAYAVPEGTTSVRTTFPADRTYRSALVAGLVPAALVVLAALVLAARRPQRDAAAVRTPRPPVALRLAGAGLLLAVTGGLAGVVLGVVAAAALGRTRERRAAVVRPLVVAGSWTVAGVLMAAGVWGTSTHATLAPVVQLLTLAGLAALVVPRPAGRPARSAVTGARAAPPREAG
ncbi:DUF3367 domain-containing protein [Phycicoccus sp. CMS6Z-2]|uniref:DUF3367 domain-containing protein n=1 Tax=Phycicoccus flavus TaxID=2502783 RepID=A0A8T6R362_9MICO|nr:DUF3367 domain-containing protein [Phycicoccus flavus]